MSGLSVILLVVCIAVLAAWCARLDYLLHQMLERERQCLEEKAERLRRQRG